MASESHIFSRSKKSNIRIWEWQDKWIIQNLLYVQEATATVVVMSWLVYCRCVYQQISETKTNCRVGRTVEKADKPYTAALRVCAIFWKLLVFANSWYYIPWFTEYTQIGVKNPKLFVYWPNLIQNLREVILQGIIPRNHYESDDQFGCVCSVQNDKRSHFDIE